MLVNHFGTQRWSGPCTNLWVITTTGSISSLLPLCSVSHYCTCSKRTQCLVRRSGKECPRGVCILKVRSYNSALKSPALLIRLRGELRSYFEVQCTVQYDSHGSLLRTSWLDRVIHVWLEMTLQIWCVLLVISFNRLPGIASHARSTPMMCACIKTSMFALDTSPLNAALVRMTSPRTQLPGNVRRNPSVPFTSDLPLWGVNSAGWTHPRPLVQIISPLGSWRSVQTPSVNHCPGCFPSVVPKTGNLPCRKPLAWSPHTRRSRKHSRTTTGPSPCWALYLKSWKQIVNRTNVNFLE